MSTVVRAVATSRVNEFRAAAEPYRLLTATSCKMGGAVAIAAPVVTPVIAVAVAVAVVVGGDWRALTFASTLTA